MPTTAQRYSRGGAGAGASSLGTKLPRAGGVRGSLPALEGKLQKKAENTTANR